MEIIIDYIEYWQENYTGILSYTYEHLILSFVSVLMAIVLAVPLGIYMTKMKSERLKNTIFNIANVFQTIPTIAMFAIMIPLLGIGFTPAITALFLYSLLPLLRNTYAGVSSIDPGIVEAAKGMGFNTIQRLFKIELPVAIPYIMSGIRVTTVYIISWTTLAAVIGAGGLGDLIIAGIGYNSKHMIFTGTILAIIIALLLDFIFGKFEKRLSNA